MSNVIVTETKIITADWTKLADAVERRVVTKLKKDLKTWADDREMRIMFLSDAADGVNVCATIAEGDWRQIEEAIHRLDTAPREYLWDFVEAELGMSWTQFTENMPQ